MSLALAAVLALAIGGLVLITLNARKLIADWPRLKPLHNVDLAWVQIYFGCVLLVVAWFIATDPAHKLTESTRVYTPDDASAAGSTAAKR